MTTSVFFTNLLWVLLVVNWVVEWNWREKFADFRQITRSQSHRKPLRRKDDILPMAKALLRQVDISEAHPIRLLGLSVSHPPAAESFSSAQPVELELEFEDWPE